MLLPKETKETFTLQEYPQYQIDAPQSIFYRIQQNTNVQRPSIPKLVFVTPWNKAAGYDLTLKYAHKLTYVSPCWYELIVAKNNTVVFENDQLIDRQYMKAIRMANPKIKIMPRIYTRGDAKVLQTFSQNFVETIKMIVKVVKQNSFDGIVWDCPYDLLVDDKKHINVNNFIVKIIKTLKVSLKNLQNGQDLKLFFNIGFPSSNVKFDLQLYRELPIDGLLIQNYDSNIDFDKMLKQSANWVNKAELNDNKREIILMLPFFSYKNGKGTNTKQVQDELMSQNISYSGFDKGMCKFISQSGAEYQVPCYSYFSKAFDLIEKHKFSAGFWQGGNGLENYYKFM